MQHEIFQAEGAVVAAFSGDIDLDSSPEARELLLQCVERGQPLLVNLAGVSYIDSSGVASLVEALQSARKRGGTMALVAVSEAALRVLKLGRLDSVFTIYDTQDEALGTVG